jgi:hypothetical protein
MLKRLDTASCVRGDPDRSNANWQVLELLADRDKLDAGLEKIMGEQNGKTILSTASRSSW